MRCALTELLLSDEVRSRVVLATSLESATLLVVRRTFLVFNCTKQYNNNTQLIIFDVGPNFLYGAWSVVVIDVVTRSILNSIVLSYLTT